MNKKKCCFLISACLALETAINVVLVNGERYSSTKARTRQGPVVGFIDYFNNQPVHVYLGVPFAKPPIGALRFRKPVSLENRNYNFYATKPPPPCFEYTNGPFISYDDGPGHSEDCLYLNIWSPGNNNVRNKKSVMFWIHGGAFNYGSARLDTYDGKTLAVTGDVIVVVFNYRLGTLGFFYSGIEDAPGNVGLYDMLAALKWTRENIEYFGGDKDKITLFGQSAGGISAGYFAVSPLTEGLYQNAIMESGSPASTLIDNQKFIPDLSESVAKLFKCSDDTTTTKNNPEKVVQCLRRVDAMKLLNNSITRKNQFIPRFGDRFLPENPRIRIRKGQFYETDLMLGIVKDEGSLLLSTRIPKTFGFFGEKDTLLNKTFAREILYSYFSGVQNREAILNFYLDSVPDHNFELIRRKTYEAMGDFSKVCSSIYTADAFTKKTKNVYYYVFAERPSDSPWAPWQGVVHADEVEFVFGKPVMYPQNFTRKETRLSEYLMRTWSNFAKTGSPGLKWPRYTGASRGLRSLKLPLQNGTFNTKNCDFFKPYFGF